MLASAVSRVGRQVLSIRCSRRPLCSRTSVGGAAMRLVQFVEGGKRRVGAELSSGGDVIDLSAADASIPHDMRSFLEGGEQNMNAARK